MLNNLMNMEDGMINLCKKKTDEIALRTARLLMAKYKKRKSALPFFYVKIYLVL